jgi:hypothetical protein
MSILLVGGSKTPTVGTPGRGGGDVVHCFFEAPRPCHMLMFLPLASKIEQGGGS